MNIIGLGKAGCNIAAAFSKFPQYHTVKIDVGKDADVTIKGRKNHEDYDTHFPSVISRLKLREGPVQVVLCGAGKISGGSLQLLAQLHDREVSVIYVQPDLQLLSEIQKIQEKIVRNVLQEYARSGKLQMLYLVDNLLLEKGVGEVPILGYFDVLNQAVVNTLHMLNIFENSEPVIGNYTAPSALSRIATIGVVDLEKEEEKWFFQLTHAREMVYYYGINEEELKTDGSLFRRITDFVKSKLEEGINISYGIFKTSYEQKYCYCIKYTSVVQSSLEEE
jgi:hypothetical protein